MSRAEIILTGQTTRQQAISLVQRAPVNSRVEFKGPRRSNEQNSAMWLWLTAIATKLDWHGQHYGAEDWKDNLMHAYRKARWMPAEDGGMVPIGLSTSSLSREEMSEFIELVIAFAARHGVTLPEIEPSPQSSTPAGSRQPEKLAAVVEA